METEKLRFLERQWELIEGNKKLRLQIPTVISSLLIAISGFIIQSNNTKLMENRLLITIVILSIFIFGFVSLLIIHKQYNYSDKKISSLYLKFKLTDLDDVRNKKLESGFNLFLLGYLSIILFSLFAIIIIWTI